MSSGYISQPYQTHTSSGANDHGGFYGNLFFRRWGGTNSVWAFNPVTHKRKRVLKDNEYGLQFQQGRLPLCDLYSPIYPDSKWTGSCEEIGPTSNPPSPWTEADELKLLARLVDQVKNNEFNLGNFVGEGHETISMFATNAARIAQALRALRKGNIAAAAKHLGVPSKQSSKSFAKALNDGRQSFANGWLELQYGWLPLLKDIHAGAETLARSQVNLPQKRRFSASGSAKFKAVMNGTQGFKFDGERIVRKRYTVVLREEYSPVASLGLLDPEVVAWELTPFSFVADWFIPIGTFLETRAHIRRFNGTWVRSIKDSYMYQCRPFSSPIWTPRDGSLDIFSKTINFDRFVSTEVPPIPLPKFKSLKKALSVRHLENALALIQQAVR